MRIHLHLTALIACAVTTPCLAQASATAADDGNRWLVNLIVTATLLVFTGLLVTTARDRGQHHD